jgi:hypothetical protein
MLRLWPQVADASSSISMARHQVLSEAALMAALSGSAARANDLVAIALKEVDRHADPERAAALLERRGHYGWLAADRDASHRAYQQAVELMRGRPPSALRAQVLAGMAKSLMFRSREQEALPYAREAIEVARQAGTPAVVGDASVISARAWRRSDRSHRACGCCTRRSRSR